MNGKSEVLVGHCRKSNGGLWYSDFKEWASVITTIDESTKAKLGQQGRTYVRRNYSWKRVEQSYLKLVPMFA